MKKILFLFISLAAASCATVRNDVNYRAAKDCAACK